MKNKLRLYKDTSKLGPFELAPDKTHLLITYFLGAFFGGLLGYTIANKSDAFESKYIVLIIVLSQSFVIMFHIGWLRFRKEILRRLSSLSAQQ